MSHQKTKIHVFDTNIFLLGIDFNVIPSKIYTTPSIIEEIRIEKYSDKNRNILNKILVAQENGKLMVKEPSKESLIRIERMARETGDLFSLSKPDKELLALTLDVKNQTDEEVIIYTNDYSMENVCSALDIEYSPMILKGIKNKIVWEVYCPFCKDIKEAAAYGGNCEECGLKLKRRPKDTK